MKISHSFLRKASGTSGNAVRERNARRACPKENAMVQKTKQYLPVFRKGVASFFIVLPCILHPKSRAHPARGKGHAVMLPVGAGCPGRCMVSVTAFPGAGVWECHRPARRPRHPGRGPQRRQSLSAFLPGGKPFSHFTHISAAFPPVFSHRRACFSCDG